MTTSVVCQPLCPLQRLVGLIFGTFIVYVMEVFYCELSPSLEIMKF